MTVTGVTQLLAAPFATLAERRFPAVVVAAFGFGLFGLGAFANILETPRSDFSNLFWPQVLRGAAVLFCILPIMNLALDEQPAAQLANASGLLNLMRNIGEPWASVSSTRSRTAGPLRSRRNSRLV